MINFLAYTFSFVMGFFLIRLVLGPRMNISFFLHCALAIGLGLGICGATTFFFLLIYGQYHAFGLIALNTLVLLVLLGLGLFTRDRIAYLPSLAPVKNETAFLLCSIFCWTLAAGAIAVLSQKYSFGGWDAWGLYNMKAKFLIWGGKDWTDVARLHWHTQPSYPLLLPLINAWIFSFSQKDLIEVASLTGVVFSLSCGLLFYSGLLVFIQRPVALIAGLLLVTTPNYIFWSTVQYADVLLAYYLLASAILLVLTLRTLEPRMALLAGLFWGLMPFAKNEGIVLAILFLSITSALLFLDKNGARDRSVRILKNLGGGAGITVAANLIFKIFFAPPTREVLYNPLTTPMPYCNVNGFLTTATFYLKTVLELGWFFIWGLVALMALANFKKWFILKESRVLTLILAGFALSLLYVYMTTSQIDLLWRLECTSTRICFYLLPTILFLSFYTLWTKTPDDQS